MDNAEWGKLLYGKITEKWPKDDEGNYETPVFLCNCPGIDMSDELKINMLEAYSIPCLRVYPGDGQFGKVILGMSGLGTDIYVPESMLDDAIQLCREDSNEDL